jgi:hypothetical protein
VTWYRIGGTMMHIRMDKRARKKWPPPCPFWRNTKAGDRVRCMAPASYLCDWLGCNVPVCNDHRQQLVAGFDFCPTHNSARGLFSRLLPAPTP